MVAAWFARCYTVVRNTSGDGTKAAQIHNTVHSIPHGFIERGKTLVCRMVVRKLKRLKYRSYYIVMMIIPSSSCPSRARPSSCGGRSEMYY